MAHRILAKFGQQYHRVVVGAWEKAQAARKYAGAVAQARVPGSEVDTGGINNRLTLSEACRILNVKPLQSGKADMGFVMERFKRLYDVNEPENGGSLYLQSKVLRARERIEAEVRQAEEEAIRKEELEAGWKPKLFR